MCLSCGKIVDRFKLPKKTSRHWHRPKDSSPALLEAFDDDYPSFGIDTFRRQCKDFGYSRTCVRESQTEGLNFGPQSPRRFNECLSLFDGEIFSPPRVIVNHDW